MGSDCLFLVRLTQKINLGMVILFADVATSSETIDTKRSTGFAELEADDCHGQQRWRIVGL